MFCVCVFFLRKTNKKKTHVCDLFWKCDFGNKLGDPTKFPNLKTSPVSIQAVEKALKSYEFNGYPPSIGLEITRKALAKTYNLPHIPVTEKDVYLTCGCSDAINISFCVLTDPGDNILIPTPGFTLYETLCGRYGFNTRHYKCLVILSFLLCVCVFLFFFILGFFVLFCEIANVFYLFFWTEKRKHKAQKAKQTSKKKIKNSLKKNGQLTLNTWNH